MNTVRTVSDTKRAFYSAHTNPINSIYRRVVDELMVEMHLLTVNQHYVYSPVYALGVVTTFDRFMQGYQPEADVASIFQALCAAVGGDAGQYRRDAEQLTSALAGKEWEQLVQGDLVGAVGDVLKALEAKKFKYTRLFGIGLYTLLETIDGEAVQDDEKSKIALKALAQRLDLSLERIQKDLDLYRGNLDKMAQAQQAIADTVAADRKRREQREQEKHQPETADAADAAAPKDEVSEVSGAASEDS